MEGKIHCILANQFKPKIKIGIIEWEMHSKILLNELQVKNQSVWLESGWLKCELLRRRHREGRIDHINFDFLSDHRGDCIGTTSKKT